MVADINFIPLLRQCCGDAFEMVPWFPQISEIPLRFPGFSKKIFLTISFSGFWKNQKCPYNPGMVNGQNGK